MVTRIVMLVLTGVAMAGLSATALAAVVASIDRALIDANESFNLTVAIDNMLSVEPDISALAEDFEVLGVPRETNSTSIYNGRINQKRIFTYQLMPRRIGVLEIPAIPVGNETSRPLAVTVRASDPTRADGKDVFVTLTADRTSTWVQAQVVLSVKIFTAVAPRQPQLKEPDFDGPEVLVQRIGDDRTFEKQIDGRAYDVIERRYAMFAQASGTINVSEVVFSARIWQQSRLSSRRLFRSEPLVIEVLPIPAPPAAYPDAAWLPAADVQLVQRWNPDSRQLPAGEPVTRELTLVADGLMASQLPPLAVAVPDGVRVYPDQPELNDGQTERGLAGQRTERFAVIAARGGEYELPALEVPWWDIAAGAWRVATVDPLVLSVSAAAGTETELPAVPSDGVADDAAASRAAAQSGELKLWQAATATAALLWLATLALWWQSRSQARPPKTKANVATTAPSAARLIRRASKAAAAGEMETCAALLREWGQREFGVPVSLSDLAERVDERAGGLLVALNRSLYGPAATPPDGAALARAVRALNRPGAALGNASDKPDALAPLAPGR